MFVTWPVLIAVSFLMHFANSSDAVADAANPAAPGLTQAEFPSTPRMGGEGGSRSAATASASPNTPSAHHSPAKRP